MIVPRNEIPDAFPGGFDTRRTPGLPSRSAYGLLIQSELDLPELEPVFADRPADLHIHLAQVPEDGLGYGKQLGPYLWASSQELWLQVPRVARFLIRQGREILIDPAPGVDEDSIRVFLLGSAFGALLFQRGLLVLHGNAIQIGERCMVFVGSSGAGKSTLAAAFMQRGYPVLADDVVAVDDQCRALPGIPRIKLWRDTAQQLKIDTEGLRRIRPEMEKFNYPMGRLFAESALPIRWVYTLSSHNQEESLFEPVKGMHRYLPLHSNTYRVRFLEGMALESGHLALCSKLSGRIRLAQITRPRLGFGVDALVDRVLGDIAENP